MKERILEFLRAENKSSAQFAEEIGVQPSGISHILSGRNNPSLDFVMKMLEKYRDLSVDWLLFGKGKMYKNPAMQSLFDENIPASESYTSRFPERNGTGQPVDQKDFKPEKLSGNISSSSTGNKASVIKIVLFYDDKTFDEYFPGK
jgi:transcriptional regulator with XRE-family HTH domain